jgi:hypothetical protein
MAARVCGHRGRRHGAHRERAGRYSYALRTTTVYRGTCREFILTLDDQSVHTAWLQFVR